SLSYVLSLFCRHLVAPPRLPVCPYTTLFRSGHDRRDQALLGGQPGADAEAEGQRQRDDPDGDAGQQVLAPGLAQEPVIRRGRPQDRKSTLLNSSHDSISYACFCLKKKKTYTF